MADKNVVNNESEIPPNLTSRLGRFGWTAIVIICVIAAVQWPRLRELYYDVGNEGSTSNISWRHDYKQALAEAKQQGKPLLIVFSASWCPPCKVMKREVWPNAEITALVEAKFVPLYLDVDEKSNSEAVNLYQVQSIPTVMVVDGNGDVLRKRNSMSRSQTLRFLDS